MGEFVNSGERRRSERIAAKRGAFAFNGRQHGSIVDASVEGLCFQYITQKVSGAVRNVRKCKATGSVDIVYGEHKFSLIGLPVKSIADYLVSSQQDFGQEVQIRRRVVTFEELGPRELFLLKRFLLLNRYGAPRQRGGPPEQPNMDPNVE